MPEKENAAGFGIGLLAGLAIGAAIGILYAPQSGRETREKLKHKVGETREKAEEILEEAKERAKKIVEDAKGKALELEKQK